VILFLALYPQLALHRSEGSVKSSVAAVKRIELVARFTDRAARCPAPSEQAFAEYRCIEG